MVVSVTELLDADQFHFLFQGNTGKVISQLLLYLGWGRVTEIRGSNCPIKKGLEIPIT